MLSSSVVFVVRSYACSRVEVGSVLDEDCFLISSRDSVKGEVSSLSECSEFFCVFFNAWNVPHQYSEWSACFLTLRLWVVGGS